jgi:hypothetical protein
MDSPSIVCIGGFPDTALWEHVLELAGGRRVLVDRTASPQFAEPLGLRGDLIEFSFYPWPPPDLREQALAADAILVCGGNTANMLAVWRVHGFDRVLREAWESDVLLTGWSAGMICWFEAGVTDSFGPQLEGLRDGLGFLPGSACPHYDGEELRRPVYTGLVRDGFPPGSRSTTPSPPSTPAPSCARSSPRDRTRAAAASIEGARRRSPSGASQDR